MNGRIIFTAILSAAAGVAIGFLLANTINRGELSELRAEVERAKASSPASGDSQADLTLTEAEIAATIAQADQSPTDFQIQRTRGTALYKYAVMKKDVGLIERSIRLLDRANKLKPDDYDVIVSLGNAHFDTGYLGKTSEPYAKAREFYAKALEIRPTDANVRTDVGLTYFLQEPADYNTAAVELKRALTADSKSEKTLEYLIQVLIKQSKQSEAADYLQQLRTVNPQNRAIDELASMLAASQAPA